MRTGPELVRASNAYAREDRARTWRLLAVTYAVYATGMVGAMGPFAWPVQLAGSLLAGFTLVRIFIFYHDYLHGAILQKSPVAKLLMTLTGYWMLSGASVWRETHDYHHKHTAKMVGASIGSYPVVTIDMWRIMTDTQRRAYRAVRHPLNMVFGYFTVFLLGMCLSAFKRNPKEHYDGLVAIVFHFGVMAAVWAVLGPAAAFYGVFLPGFLTSALGSYLFYAQHNFPGMVVQNRREWEYTVAATRASSMFDMSPIAHWFTGNIGFHHVHHLNHRIPFYRLPEAMADMPELQDPGRTTWTPSDLLACLRLAVWDPANKRMLTWPEVADAVSSGNPELMSAK